MYHIIKIYESIRLECIQYTSLCVNDIVLLHLQIYNDKRNNETSEERKKIATTKSVYIDGAYSRGDNHTWNDDRNQTQEDKYHTNTETRATPKYYEQKAAPTKTIIK